MKSISEPVSYAEYVKRLETINEVTGESIKVTIEAYNAYVEQINKNRILMIEAQQSYEEAKKIQEQLTKKLKYYRILSSVISPRQRKMISKVYAMGKR